MIRFLALGLGFSMAFVAHASPSSGQALVQPVSSSFGLRRDPMNGEMLFHRGVDFPARLGAPVRAAAPGRVAFAGRRGGYGLLVEVDHQDGSRARYAHLSSTAVRPGDIVSATTLIGQVGSTGRSTGPHLHFEYWVGGRAVDPLPYFSAAASPPDRRSRPEADKPTVHRSSYALLRCRASTDGGTATGMDQDMQLARACD